MSNFDPWDNFDPIYYVDDVYRQPLLEEQTLIRKAVLELADLSTSIPAVIHAADIGTGPNFYPPMHMSGVLAQGGSIELIEYLPQNRAYLETIIESDSDEFSYTDKRGVRRTTRTREPWKGFDTLIASIIPDDKRFSNTFDKARKASTIHAGNIYTLAPRTYDFVSSFFVAESITDDPAKCTEGLTSILGSVKSGGGFMIALVVNSDSYSAGKDTLFPATSMTIEDIEAYFTGQPIVKDCKVLFAGRGEDSVRPGYAGLAVAIGSVN